MKWLSLIAGIVQALILVTRWLESRRSLQAGEATLALKLLQETQDAVAKAQNARRAVRDELVRHPERLRDTDPFERKD